MSLLKQNTPGIPVLEMPGVIILQRQTPIGGILPAGQQPESTNKTIVIPAKAGIQIEVR